MSLDNNESTNSKDFNYKDSLTELSQITDNSDFKILSSNNQIILEVDAVQKTLNSIKNEMKEQRNVSNNES